MVNLELLNKGEIDDTTLVRSSIEEVKNTFAEINLIKNSLLTKNDLYIVKNKTYINKSWYRKLAIAFSISIKVISENRIESWDKIIYNFTVRASTPLWRYIEASSSCSSIERDFNNIEHEVRSIAQTRGSNRAIWELIWLYETCLSNLDKNIPKSLKDKPEQDISNDEITAKQKRLLIKLIESKYQDEGIRNVEYKKIDSLNKSEARIIIRDLIESWVEY